MSKEIFYKILYKLMYGKLRRRYKELHKKEKSLRLAHERAVKDNMFVLIKENGEKVRNPKIDGLTVEFYGKDSVVEIREPYWFDNCTLRIGNNSLIQIKETNYPIQNLSVSPLRDSSLLIGSNFRCGGVDIRMDSEPHAKVIIGDDCLFSFDIIIWPSDGHAIISDQGEYLNKGENITIGNHVWLGMGVNILKGSVLPDNSIVAARSVVTKNLVKAVRKATVPFGGGGGLSLLGFLPVWSNPEGFLGRKKAVTIIP